MVLILAAEKLLSNQMNELLNVGAEEGAGMSTSGPWRPQKRTSG
jgi:hypothetical protein